MKVAKKSDQDKVKSLEHDPELQEMFEAGNRDEIIDQNAEKSHPRIFCFVFGDFFNGFYHGILHDHYSHNMLEEYVGGTFFQASKSRKSENLT